MRRRLDTYAAVLFDCDDTILQTAKKRWSVMIATARGFACTIDESHIRAVWGLPFAEMIRTLLPQLDYDQYVEAYRAAMSESAPEPTPGARELLAYLHERNVQMRIVTSSSRDLIVQDLEALDLGSYFTEIYGHEQTRFHKPDPRALERPIADFTRQRIGRGDLVYIGDSARDYLAARGNEVDFIGVTTGLESAHDLRKTGVRADMIVACLDELLPPAFSSLPTPRGGVQR